MHTFCHIYQKQINTSGDLKIVSSDMVADKIESPNLKVTVITGILQYIMITVNTEKEAKYTNSQHAVWWSYQSIAIFPTFQFKLLGMEQTEIYKTAVNTHLSNVPFCTATRNCTLF